MLKGKNSSLAKQVFKMSESPNKQDFVTQISSDLDLFQISLSSTDIEMLSESKFKKVFKEACIKSAFNYLVNENEKLSKGRTLKYTCLNTQTRHRS